MSRLNIFNINDNLLLKNNLDKLKKQIDKKANELYNPSKETKKNINNIILKYIKDNKRKIYGGYAIHQLVKNKNKTDGIYNIDEYPDIDFYSPDPNSDIINICNIIAGSGYTRINGKEAKHQNTYSVFVDFELYCDITYVPKKIYNKIKFIELDNIRYVHPNFIIIDYLRIITDPINSHWRLEKSLNRLIKLQQYYPLFSVNDRINISPSDNDDNINKAYDKIIQNLSEDNIIIGFYAFNQFLKICKQNEITIPFIEIISKNFIQDVNKLLDVLRTEFQDMITYTEYYPFFHYIGNMVEIYLNGELICIVYDYDKRCYSYQDINNLKIGSFSLVLLYSLINNFKYRLMEDNNVEHLYKIMISELIKLRQNHFKKTKTNIFSDTIFKDFIIDCIGPSINPEHQLLIKYEKRRSKNKPSLYIYDPIKQRKEEKDKNFCFRNLSGNVINNPKHTLLDKTNINDDDDESELDNIDKIDEIDEIDNSDNMNEIDEE
jgi:hypothetical protein